MQNDIGSLYMKFVLLSIIFYRAFFVSKIRKSVSMKKLYFHVSFSLQSLAMIPLLHGGRSLVVSPSDLDI